MIVIKVGRDAAVRVLLVIPWPDRTVPRVLGIDDFALRRCHDYATVVIDADTGTRIWHGLCGAAGKEVAAHSACGATVTGLRQKKLAETTLHTLTVGKLSGFQRFGIPDLLDVRDGEDSCSAD